MQRMLLEPDAMLNTGAGWVLPEAMVHKTHKRKMKDD